SYARLAASPWRTTIVVPRDPPSVKHKSPGLSRVKADAAPSGWPLPFPVSGDDPGSRRSLPAPDPSYPSPCRRIATSATSTRRFVDAPTRKTDSRSVRHAPDGTLTRSEGVRSRTVTAVGGAAGGRH